MIHEPHSVYENLRMIHTPHSIYENLRMIHQPNSTYENLRKTKSLSVPPYVPRVTVTCFYSLENMVELVHNPVLSSSETSSFMNLLQIYWWSQYKRRRALFNWNMCCVIAGCMYLEIIFFFFFQLDNLYQWF